MQNGARPGLISCSSLLLWLAACARSVTSPDAVDQPRDAYVPVPYPPPAALAETVPPDPGGGAVWLDGDWVFQGQSYVWQRGGWVYPERDARFAPARSIYLPDGRLLLAPGTWFDRQGRRLPPPDIAVPATTPPNELTAESQTGR